MVLLGQSSRPPLLAVPPTAAVDLLGGSGRAKIVWSQLRDGRDPFEESSGLGHKARHALELAFSAQPPHSLLTSTVSACGTRKLLLRLRRGDEVEAVIIPQGAFSTLCVSSQVGCRQGCTFCATGTMGLLRSLAADEILAQLHAAAAAVRQHGMPPLRNVVFMGMGEPADNVEEVSRALHAMVHPFGFQLGRSYVCVSTVGPSPGHIRALEPLPARLAWSVHAADDRLRRLLVPTTRHRMSELRDAWGETLQASSRLHLGYTTPRLHLDACGRDAPGEGRPRPHGGGDAHRRSQRRRRRGGQPARVARAAARQDSRQPHPLQRKRGAGRRGAPLPAGAARGGACLPTAPTRPRPHLHGPHAARQRGELCVRHAARRAREGESCKPRRSGEFGFGRV
mmetsp:Transcript_27587/g.88541  ORF Transcript_27587/g.88541 Transcript_27587/m.88541 type:complete len:396 (-) Transcript_27587:74-1261(-)